MVARVLADELGRVIADRVGVVVFFGAILRVVGHGEERVVADEGAGVPETAGPLNGAVVAVEAALERPVVTLRLGFGGVAGREVPLARDVVPVAGGLEDFGHRHAPPAEFAAIGIDAVVVQHVADAGLMRVEAGEERGARGTAAGGIVEVREAQAAGGERIEIGRGDLAAEAADVGIAHIVGEDEDDVGALGGAPHRANDHEQREADQVQIHARKRESGGVRTAR